MTVPTVDASLFEACLRIEAEGWKGRNGSAILSHESTTQFYRAVGGLPGARLWAISVPRGPIAFALCLLHRDRLFLIKTGYDERYSSLSPGHVLHHALIGHCHELGLAAYELLGKDDPWKLRFANTQRSISRLVAYQPGVIGQCRLAARRLRPALKKCTMRF